MTVSPYLPLDVSVDNYQCVSQESIPTQYVCGLKGCQNFVDELTCGKEAITFILNNNINYIRYLECLVYNIRCTKCDPDKYPSAFPCITYVVQHVYFTCYMCATKNRSKLVLPKRDLSKPLGGR